MDQPTAERALKEMGGAGWRVAPAGGASQQRASAGRSRGRLVMSLRAGELVLERLEPVEGPEEPDGVCAFYGYKEPTASSTSSIPTIGTSAGSTR